MKSQEELNRLFWHSRRGMLELDVLLVPFLKEAFNDLSEADQARYEKLLTSEDQDMFAWFMRKEVPQDPDLERIVNIIINRVHPG
ncbi:succinate dehydrogenase assembly factor 2 [Aestuariirhabdus sp. LZHN29]|uniref:FAD assembly factor SdhE n=1 Tax=Aestuariirhabdus sp. LZHN29 TaxID=3417462 RepID=UPI003CF5AF5C